jgi:hypothetical protein
MTAAAYSNKGSTPVERQMVGDFTEAEMAEAIAKQDREAGKAPLPTGWIPDINDPSADAADRWEQLGVDRFSLQAAAWHEEAKWLRSLPKSSPELTARVNRACAEIGREVGYRRSCYPRWVTAGKMSQAKADEQIGALVDAAALLRELSGVTR